MTDAFQTVDSQRIDFKKKNGHDAAVMVYPAELLDNGLPVIPERTPKPTRDFFLHYDFMIVRMPDSVIPDMVDFLVQFVTSMKEVAEDGLGEKTCWYVNGLRIAPAEQDASRLDLASCGDDPGLAQVAEYDELWTELDCGLYLIHSLRPDDFTTGWLDPVGQRRLN